MNAVKEKNCKAIRDGVVDGTGWFGVEWPRIDSFANLRVPQTWFNSKQLEYIKHDLNATKSKNNHSELT